MIDERAPWRCQRGWHRWMFEAMTDVRSVESGNHYLPICTLTERCGRCGIRRTTYRAAPPRRPPVLMKAQRGQSNFHSWNSLHQIVRQGIHANTDSEDPRSTAARCGCHSRAMSWWLCQYHEGMQDGVGLLMDELLAEAQRELYPVEEEEAS